MGKKLDTLKIVFFELIQNTSFFNFLVVLSLSMSLAFVTGLLYYTYHTNNSPLYCNKAIIQSDLKTLIDNGGNLNDVKDVYRKRVLKKHSGIEYFKEEDYYNENVPLSEVLSDLRIKYFLEKKQRRYSRKTYKIKDSILVDADSLYFSLLNTIIDEYNKKNPFDKLEPNQRDIFINLQQKLDTGYVKVSGDISKIVDEMEDRNQLVTKYLNDSKTSLRISWIALFVTVILSIFQICQNWISSKKHKKHLDEIEKKINKKE